MKKAFRFLSVLLVCIVVFAGLLAAFASPTAPLFAQDTAPAGAAQQLTAAQLGIAPDVAPQPSPVTAAQPDAPVQAAVSAGGPPVLATNLADVGPLRVDVPPAFYGVDPAAQPQAVPLFLSMLYLPAVRGGASSQAYDAGVLAGTVSAYNAYTADTANVAKTVFSVGETIRYFGVVNNPTTGVRSVFVTWFLNGPCGTSTLRAVRLNAGPGFTQWYVQGTVPNCPGAYTYTFSANDSGSLTSVSSAFTVLGPGSVTMSSVATLDAADAPTNTFATGAVIKYVAFLNNTTATTQTVPLVYLLAGPCGAGELFSGDVNTPAGVQAWALSRIVPGCTGIYTLTAQVTYNAITTQSSIPFTVFQGDTVVVTAARTANTANTTQTAFPAGAPIRYMGTISNTAVLTQTAHSVWSVAGPGCNGTLWEGDLAVPPGAREWYLDGVAAPYCSGSNTFTVAVTYNALTTTRTAAYTIAGGTIPPVPAALNAQ